MKKFFLIPLLALFTCVNMWADPVEVTTSANLRSELEAGHDVKLMSDITISSNTRIKISNSVTLDLNTHSIENAITFSSFDFYFQDNTSSEGKTFTIKNGYFTKSENSVCKYPLNLQSLKYLSVVLDSVTVDEGNESAMRIQTTKADKSSVTIQGTCTIPSIKFWGSKKVNLVNDNDETFETSLIDAPNNNIPKTIINNGTLKLGEKTHIVGSITKDGTGTWDFAPGAEFASGAWTALELQDFCDNKGYKVESTIQQNSWDLVYKIKETSYISPTPKARFNGHDYPSVLVAMAAAYAAGGEQTVTLLENDEYETTASIMSNADITLDLNHRVLTVGTPIHFECEEDSHGKLTVRDGEITSTSSDIFVADDTNTSNQKPELTLENVIVTNTHNQNNTYISQRGRCIKTSGFFKLTLSGTTDCPVYLNNVQFLDDFDFTNNGNKIYVFAQTSAYTTAYYIVDDKLLNKFGASNTNWEIWQGYIKDDVKDSYISPINHIKGSIAEAKSNVGSDDSKIDAYLITEEELPIVATVNGTSYHSLIDALKASSAEHKAELSTDVYDRFDVNYGNSYYLDLKGHTLSCDFAVPSMINHGQLLISSSETGGKINTYSPFYIIGSSDPSATDYSVLEIGANVTVNYTGANYVLWVAENANNTAYGVRVNLAGTVNSTVSGAYINGNIQAVSAHAPIFNISGTLDAAITGIYAAGYGIWNITGTVKGNDGFGLGIKGGQLNMTAGKIYAGGDDHRVVGYNNGMYKSGAALQIESNNAYAGAMTINITGGELESNRGYAIYEYVAKSNDPTAVQTIAIANDSTAHKLDANNPVVYPLFQGGICISQSLASKGGFVSGGKWSKDISANVVKGKAANPISEDPYFFEVGAPTSATAEKDNDGLNAVLVNAAATSAEISAAQSEAGRETAVKTTATNSVVVTENTDVVVAGNKDIVDVKKVTVEGTELNPVELTVKEGATLNVGTGAVLIGENATLTVEEGAALVVDGLVYGATADNFVVKSSEQKSAIVLFSPETEFIKEDHPKATYRFTSKSFYDYGNPRWVFQRFGMPSHDGIVTMKSTKTTVSSYVYTWNGEDWGAPVTMPTEGLVYNVDNKAVPFQCYQLASTNIKDKPTTYDFVVELMGNANAPLNFKAGWNPYANSYTAPIDIREFLTDVLAEAGTGIDATVYLYKDLGNDTYTWQAINLTNAGKTYRVREDGAMVKKTFPGSIEPMQAFIMKLGAGESEETDINYLNSVYNPAMGIARSAAPARNRASYNEVQIGAYNELYWDNISLMEGNEFSAEYDNGFDAPKYDNNKGLSLYITNGEKHMERIATDNIEGLFIGIDAPVAGEYTMDFSGVNGMDYVVVDMQTGSVFEIAEDAEFQFYTEAGKNDYRFQLVVPAKVPTAIENTVVNANLKGVYTITGQFVGEDLNILPKGVYVVNGVKVVK